jgi:Mg2+ and Co2+ transporter CorA
MTVVELASDTRWRPGSGYVHGDGPPQEGDVVWLDFREQPDGEAAALGYYDIAPIAERLEALRIDAVRRNRRGRTRVHRSLTGLFAPRLGHRGSGTFTAFGVDASPALAEKLGAFSCVRSVRVSLVALPGCLVTVRHRPNVWVGRRSDASVLDAARALGEPPEADAFAGSAALHRVAEARWLERPDQSSVADLTLVVLRLLSGSLQPAVSYLAGRLDEAEQVYFSVLDSADDRLDDAALRTAQRNLFELAGVLASFGRELSTLTDNIPAEPGDWIVDEADAQEAQAAVREYRDAMTAIRDLRQDLRTSVDMTASTLASHQLVIASRQEERAREQLRLAEEQRDRNDRFMRDATLIASLVLLPTLVATVYGAEVALPLKNRAAGTALMLAVMLVLAFAAWQALRTRYPGGRR